MCRACNGNIQCTTAKIVVEFMKTENRVTASYGVSRVRRWESKNPQIRGKPRGKKNEQDTKCGAGGVS